MVRCRIWCFHSETSTFLLALEALQISFKTSLGLNSSVAAAWKPGWFFFYFIFFNHHLRVNLLSHHLHDTEDAFRPGWETAGKLSPRRWVTTRARWAIRFGGHRPSAYEFVSRGVLLFYILFTPSLPLKSGHFPNQHIHLSLTEVKRWNKNLNFTYLTACICSSWTARRTQMTKSLLFFIQSVTACTFPQ